MSPDLGEHVRRLRSVLSTTASRFDFPFLNLIFLQVLQHLTYELYRVDDDTLRRALLSLLELVRHWAVVPSV